MSSDFADLARDRSLLQKFCEYHPASLMAFRSAPSFKLHVDETPSAELRHLTSTGTCIESLFDCPSTIHPNATRIAKDFAIRAIQRPSERWKSEDSAAIYCRCRALPLVVEYLCDEDLVRYRRELQGHIETILRQLEEPDRFAVGEADPDTETRRDWYPPNAYHTFWFLTLLEKLSDRLGTATYDTFLSGRRAKEMQLWARSLAGRQVALHSVKSPTLDSDQLAWSLAILIRFGLNFQSSLTDQDFLRAGFKALFSTQTKAGTWPHGQRLFHYRYSGNAYCYVYETFTALLKSVLYRQNEGEFLRSAIAPFRSNLMRLWEYARDTQIPLKFETEALQSEHMIGWSSGHRIEDSRAESWATASVFSYAQTLRRLVGIWSREEGAIGLKNVTTFASPQGALDAIAKRGDTWGLPFCASSVSQDLMTLFVNPVRQAPSKNDLEPDEQPIRDEQARSAILFGPPGTSKTTLARGVAGAIGWRYVELHASHFVAHGLPAVQRTADAIFQQLMELDHTVVLFDEIDELVRERDMEPDAFGRFLTTSMLPKLAELWEQRKVIYFIATNHIEYFDRAVTRARRFDALIFVTPPSFDSKVVRLSSILSKWYPKVSIKIAFTEEQIVDAFQAISFVAKNPDDDRLPSSHSLAKFILLRWDQLEELAIRILNLVNDNQTDEIIVSHDLVTAALAQISDPSLQMRKTYLEFGNSARYTMRDYGKETVWEVEGLALDGDYSEPIRVSNGFVWLNCVKNPVELKGLPFVFAVGKNGKVNALTKIPS